MPHDKLKALQDEGRFTELMVLNEEIKTLPFGDIWEQYCKSSGVPTDGELFGEVDKYEKEVLIKRG